jgi:hypothetical protein
MKPSQRIGIINKTTFSTRDFRKIFTIAFREWHKKHIKPQRIRVEISWTKRTGIHGYAWIGGHSVILRIPNAKKDLEEFSPITIADIISVFLHEVDHCSGTDHNDMAFRNKYYPEYDSKKFEGMTVKNLGLKAPKPKPTTGDKIIQIAQRLKRWQSKEKRAQTAIKKLQRHLKRYQKVQVAELSNTYTGIAAGEPAIKNN